MFLKQGTYFLVRQKMLQSVLESAKNNPFCSPFHIAHCEPLEKEQQLVQGRTIAAAAVAADAGGKTFIF